MITVQIKSKSDRSKLQKKCDYGEKIFDCNHIVFVILRDYNNYKNKIIRNKIM
jgi:hypothetical protein